MERISLSPELGDEQQHLESGSIFGYCTCSSVRSTIVPCRKTHFSIEDTSLSIRKYIFCFEFRPYRKYIILGQHIVDRKWWCTGRYCTSVPKCWKFPISGTENSFSDRKWRDTGKHFCNIGQCFEFSPGFLEFRRMNTTRWSYRNECIGYIMRETENRNSL